MPKFYGPRTAKVEFVTWPQTTWHLIRPPQLSQATAHCLDEANGQHLTADREFTFQISCTSSQTQSLSRTLPSSQSSARPFSFSGRRGWAFWTNFLLCFHCGVLSAASSAVFSTCGLIVIFLPHITGMTSASPILINEAELRLSGKNRLNGVLFICQRYIIKCISFSMVRNSCM